MRKPDIKKTDEWAHKPWHLALINDGVEIQYVNSNGFAIPIPLEGDGDGGHSMSTVFAKYLVYTHNRTL